MNELEYIPGDLVMVKKSALSKGEFVQYKGKELVDEEGTILPKQEFWAIRSGGSWENGWEEYKED